MGPKDLEHLTRKLLKQAGVYTKGSGDHGFRHAFQGEFLANGGQEIQAKVLMGHAPSNMTQHYYHLANKEAVAAVNKFAPRRFLQCPLDCKFNQAVKP
jgi:integrase